MKHPLFVIASLLLLTGAIQAGEPSKDNPPRVSDTEPPVEIKNKLSKKVSFEFVETPLEEAVTFLRSLSNVNVIMDPKASEAGKDSISLRVQDMDLGTALKWIVKLCDLELRFQDDSVFITETAERTAARRAAEKQREEMKQNDAKLAQKLRLKFPDGHEVELEGSIAREHVVALLERMERKPIASKPSSADSGVVICRMDTDLANCPKALALRLIKKATGEGCEFTEDGKVLIITSKDENALRRAEKAIDFIRSQKSQLKEEAPQQPQKAPDAVRPPPPPGTEKNAF